MSAVPETCGTCKFYRSGECWRYPPTVLLDSDGRHRYERPAVNAVHDSCGEWVEREGVR